MEIINYRLFTITDIVLLASLLVVFIMQMYFLLRYYLKLARHRNNDTNPGDNRISIIMSVRNEEQHIREIIGKFNEQHFEDYQILVINVHSEDNTDGILSVLAETNPKLKVTTLSQETQFSEKQIINIGLKGSSSPWIVLLTSSSGEINPDWAGQHEWFAYA